MVECADAKEQVCITDFGFDEHYRSDRVDWYQPLKREEASVERDIYSAGAIFYHILTGEPLKFAHRRIQPNSGFEKLDVRLQKLLRNMLESDSSGYFTSFEGIIPLLKSLKGKLPDPYKNTVKQGRFKPWHIIAGVLLLNLTAFSIYLYFNPELLPSLMLKFGEWRKMITSYFGL